MDRDLCRRRRAMTNDRHGQESGTPRDGAWFSTLPGVRQATPVWAEIAHYEEPIRRFLALRYRQVPSADRDDLTQAILLAMHERIVPGFDRSVGRFRAYLKSSIHRKVMDWYRQKKRTTPVSTLGTDLDETPREPDDTETLTLDLEAELLRAVRSFHDRFTFGTDRERTTVRCFGLRVLQGLPEKEIARALHLNRDQVKYFLKAARQELTTELCRGLLARIQEPVDEAQVRRAADLVRQGLRAPVRRWEPLDAEPCAAVRDAAENLLQAIDAVRDHFLGLETAAGAEFLRALEAIFQPR